MEIEDEVGGVSVPTGLWDKPLSACSWFIKMDAFRRYMEASSQGSNMEATSQGATDLDEVDKLCKSDPGGLF